MGFPRLFPVFRVGRPLELVLSPSTVHLFVGDLFFSCPRLGLSLDMAALRAAEGGKASCELQTTHACGPSRLLSAVGSAVIPPSTDDDSVGLSPPTTAAATATTKTTPKPTPGGGGGTTNPDSGLDDCTSTCGLSLWLAHAHRHCVVSLSLLFSLLGASPFSFLFAHVLLSSFTARTSVKKTPCRW